jgi:hypothetical protein
MAICLSKYGPGSAAQSHHGPTDFELTVNVAIFPTDRMMRQPMAGGAPPGARMQQASSAVRRPRWRGIVIGHQE